MEGRGKGREWRDEWAGTLPARLVEVVVAVHQGN